MEISPDDPSATTVLLVKGVFIDTALFFGTAAGKLQNEFDAIDDTIFFVVVMTRN
jgi:hypothetical protein